MRALDRRRFLVLGAAGLAGAAWGRTGEEGAEGAAEAFGREWLRGEVETARGMGKPLLVLVAATEFGESYSRGELLGMFLTHAESDALAPIALTHVVCASMADVRAVLGDAAPDAEPLMVLVETEGALVVRVLDPFPDLRDLARRRHDVVRYRKRIDALGEELCRALLGDAGVRERRVAQCLSALSAGDLDRLRDAPALDELDVGVIDRGAAWLADRALEADPPLRAATDRALAAAAANRLRDTPPPGARWATREVCDFIVDGDEPRPAHACGMGRVPPLGRRFLLYYAHP